MIGPRFPDLLAAAQGGDEQAFAVRWRKLQPAVWRHFQVATREAAEDLAERLSERRAPDDPASRWWTASRPGRRRPWWPELPVGQAEVVALRVLGGLGVAEVARIVGSARGRCACWPIGACGAWPTRWPGCWAV